MPRTTERVMRGCFPAVRRPALPSPPYEGSKSATGTGSGSRPSSVSKPSAFVDDDEILYPSEAEPEADAARLSSAIASRRFFLSSPGQSNSIVDSAEHATQRLRGSADNNATCMLRRAATDAFSPMASTAVIANKPKRALPPTRLRYDEVHAVQMMSGTPRADFLKSMVEMADAMGLDPRHGAADVASLQELLLCYIAVNEHDALRDIIGAYADLLRLFDGEGHDADAQHGGSS